MIKLLKKATFVEYARRALDGRRVRYQTKSCPIPSGEARRTGAPEVTGCRALLIVLVFFAAARTVDAAQTIQPPGSDTVACRVLEAESSAKFAVRLVIFHYRDAADRDRLGGMLREYDGSTVRFQAHDAVWRSATVLRLTTCFGRGMLVYAVSGPPLVKGEDFVLQVPAQITK